MTPVCVGSFWTTRDWLCTIVVRASEIVTDGVGDQQPLLWVLSGLLVGLVAPIIWIVASRYLTRKRAKAGSAPAEHTDESGKSTSPHGGAHELTGFLPTHAAPHSLRTPHTHTDGFLSLPCSALLCSTSLLVSPNFSKSVTLSCLLIFLFLLFLFLTFLILYFCTFLLFLLFLLFYFFTLILFF